jgi:hypothetical protein
MRIWQATVVLAGAALGWAAAGAQPAPHEAGESDQPVKKFVVWNEITLLPSVRGGVDVAFMAMGRNIVNPVEMVWVLESGGELAAVAAKSIDGTATAGEEMGRRGRGVLRGPRAVDVCQRGSYVLETGDRLVVMRSAQIDSLQLTPGPDGVRDLAVGANGLLYVLLGSELRVYADPPTGAPIWIAPIDPDVLPAAALAVSNRGEIYVAGQGQQALAVYDLDGRGRLQRARGAAARALGVGGAAGVALTPALLLPLDEREGWPREDQFVLLADPGGRAILALDPASLKPVGRWDLGTTLPDAAPGRLAVSNRGQVAFVDPATGKAWTLPARILADLVQSAEFPWRDLAPAEPHPAPAPADSSSGGSPR